MSKETVFVYWNIGIYRPNRKFGPLTILKKWPEGIGLNKFRIDLGAPTQVLHQFEVWGITPNPANPV